MMRGIVLPRWGAAVVALLCGVIVVGCIVGWFVIGSKLRLENVENYRRGNAIRKADSAEIAAWQSEEYWIDNKIGILNPAGFGSLASAFGTVGFFLAAIAVAGPPSRIQHADARARRVRGIATIVAGTVAINLLITTLIVASSNWACAASFSVFPPTSGWFTSTIRVMPLAMATTVSAVVAALCAFPVRCK